jgi:plasmid replication initiation protein
MLIYLISLMQERMNRSEKMNRVFRFTGHDFFRINGTKPNGNAYIRIEQSLDRLKSTTIKTNLLDDDGKSGHTAAFSWIDDYDILWRENKNGDRSMKSVTVALSSRLYNAILNNKRILTYDAAYFQLKPLEKRLYEIARAHVGQQKAFRMNLEKLRLRVGIQNDLRRFKASLQAIASQRKSPLPGYALTLLDPRIKRSLDRKAPAPTGRTPLKAYEVYFFKTERMSAIPAPYDAPSFEELEGEL